MQLQRMLSFAFSPIDFHRFERTMSCITNRHRKFAIHPKFALCESVSKIQCIIIPNKHRSHIAISIRSHCGPMFSKGAAQNEVFVCQVFSAKAEKHVAGKWIGCLTQSTRSINEFVEILNEHFGVDVALLPRLRRSRRFQLGPSMWHADVVGELLRLAGWLGFWRRVCSKLGLFRPCLLR